MDCWKVVGKVKAFSSSEVNESPVGLGFEKLDRGVFDPEKAYDKVAQLGVKWIRIQSGWARTETEKGVYHWEWLDSIVENLLRRGLQPWICLCYGNGLYDAAAAKIFGAVGCPPIHTEEQREAWMNYVSALTERYRRKVQWYEVWNEPDGSWCWKHGVSGTEYGEFIKATAAAVRIGDPDAKVIGGSTCLEGLGWINDVLATGAGKVMDALTYHAYSTDETGVFERVDALRRICRAYNPAIRLIQGETGAQSRSDGQGALHGAAWTPERQAKFLARHMISDLFQDILFASYFSCLDMVEALNGSVDNKASYLDYGYFGVLGADFDENGVASGEYRPKMSYRTLQVIASIFREKFSREEFPVFFASRGSARLLRNEDPVREVLRKCFRKPNGSCTVAYWIPKELLTTSYEGTITVETALVEGTPRLIDVIDGTVYEIPEANIEDNGRGVRIFRNIPLKDSPLLLTFGDFADVEPC